MAREYPAPRRFGDATEDLSPNRKSGIYLEDLKRPSVPKPDVLLSLNDVEAVGAVVPTLVSPPKPR
jgi:hypothetical protein